MNKYQKLNDTFLTHRLNKMTESKQVFGAALCIESSDEYLSWHGAAGNAAKDDSFFIASVTKLCVTIVMLKLIEENRIRLDDKIAIYLPADVIHGLHILKGIDYSGEITVKHLLSNTSGLPDYFFHRQASGLTVADEIAAGKDAAWPLDKTLALVKTLKPKFRPGQSRKVAYSDTNYQLLGKIIEIITEKGIHEVFKEYIFDVLKLQHTYVYQDVTDTTPLPFYFKSNKLWLPNYMASIAVEGGIVSTSRELMLILKAFFAGTFFPVERINGLKKWRLLFGPGVFYFGIGLEKLFAPRIISPFKPIGEILGFWGQTGSFAFHHPTTGLFFTGTTNQINGKGHQAAGSAMLKIIKRAL